MYYIIDIIRSDKSTLMYEAVVLIFSLWCSIPFCENIMKCVLILLVVDIFVISMGKI